MIRPCSLIGFQVGEIERHALHGILRFLHRGIGIARKDIAANHIREHTRTKKNKNTKQYANENNFEKCKSRTHFA